MIRNSQEILKAIKENRDKIKGFGVTRLGLFGSAVRGEATDTSDLDFVVEFKKKTFDAYMNLKRFLVELFGCKVDLVIQDGIKPRLREPILKETLYLTHS
ncbi:MAG: nucleotidyltransferase family protein [Thermodesulfobacteriota bacterium]